MPFKLGTSDVTALRLGTTPVSKLYLGTQLIFGAVPTQPLNLIATKSGSDVLLDWDPPANDNGSPVTDYIIEYSPLTVYDDDFNRGTSTDISTSMQPRVGGSFAAVRLDLVSNRVKASALGGAICVEDMIADAPSADMYACLTVQYNGATAIGLLMRGVRDSSRNEVGIEINDLRQYDLVEFINNGGHNSIAVSPTNAVPIGTDIRLRGELRGNQARFYVNETLTLQATLTAQFTGKRVGFGCTELSGSFTSIFDDFQVGALDPQTWSTYSESVSTVSAATLSGLSNGEYYFRVKARNAAGDSSPSAVSARIKLGGNLPVTTAPAAPAAPTGTPGNTQVALTWTAPSDGGSLITGYVVQRADSPPGTSWSAAGTPTGTSHTVTGLTNAQAYVFRVAAVNAVGQGSFSAASAALTPYTPALPPAPTGVVGTSGNTFVALTWTASSASGGPITDYKVEYALQSAPTTWIPFTDTVTPTPDAIVTGLTNGTAYIFHVAAVNATGQGSFSTASAAVTPAVTAIYDSFDRANNTTLGTNWTGITTGRMQIASNRATAETGFSVNCVEQWAAPMPGPDHECVGQLVIAADINSGGFEARCRMPAGVDSGYAIQAVGGGWGPPGGQTGVRLVRITAGAEVDIGGGFTTLTTTNGSSHSLKVTATGSTIKGFVNGVERWSVTDTVHSTGTYVGLRIVLPSANHWAIDYFGTPP